MAMFKKFGTFIKLTKHELIFKTLFLLQQNVV